MQEIPAHAAAEAARGAGQRRSRSATTRCCAISTRWTVWRPFPGTCGPISIPRMRRWTRNKPAAARDGHRFAVVKGWRRRRRRAIVGRCLRRQTRAPSVCRPVPTGRSPTSSTCRPRRCRWCGARDLAAAWDAARAAATAPDWGDATLVPLPPRRWHQHRPRARRPRCLLLGRRRRRHGRHGHRYGLSLCLRLLALVDLLARAAGPSRSGLAAPRRGGDRARRCCCRRDAAIDAGGPVRRNPCSGPRVTPRGARPVARRHKAAPGASPSASGATS